MKSGVERHFVKQRGGRNPQGAERDPSQEQADASDPLECREFDKMGINGGLGRFARGIGVNTGKIVNFRGSQGQSDGGKKQKLQKL